MRRSFRSAPNAASALAGFDYSILPISAQKAVREQTESIHGLLAKASASVVQIGLRLQFVRDRLGRDHFQPWLKAEFAWSQPTASNYMRAAKTFEGLDCLAQFQPSALFVLSRRKVPVAAQAEAVRLARSGATITRAAAVDILIRYVPATATPTAVVDRFRRSLLKALPTLSSDDRVQLMTELLRLAQEVRVPAVANDLDTHPRQHARVRRRELLAGAAAFEPPRAIANVCGNTS